MTVCWSYRPRASRPGFRFWRGDGFGPPPPSSAVRSASFTGELAGLDRSAFERPLR